MVQEPPRALTAFPHQGSGLAGHRLVWQTPLCGQVTAGGRELLPRFSEHVENEAGGEAPVYKTMAPVWTTFIQ